MDNPEDLSIWGYIGESVFSNYYKNFNFEFKKCNKPGNCKSGALKTDEEIDEWLKTFDILSRYKV